MSTVISKMKRKATVRCSCKSIGMAKLKKTIPSVGKHVGHWKLSLMGNPYGHRHTRQNLHRCTKRQGKQCSQPHYP